jgi:uncharacterized protein YecE (DUF72 family)
MTKYRIGCSGFLYDSWRGNFYPEHLPHKGWLPFYAQRFNTVELNVTFYRLLKKEAFERWYRETPPDFTFVLKGSRFITHIKKLKDVELPLSTFFNLTATLKEKFEVVLWQLPPTLRLNLKNFENFLKYLKPYPVRHAFEFRNKSWICKSVFRLLTEYNMAACMADWPEFIDELPLTADFVYLRRHGEEGNYQTDYTTEQLKKDASRIKGYLKEGKDVYMYFNNDAYGHAPKNALELCAILERSLPKALKQVKETKKASRPKKKPATKGLKRPSTQKSKAPTKKSVKKKASRKTAVKKKR